MPILDHNVLIPAAQVRMSKMRPIRPPSRRQLGALWASRSAAAKFDANLIAAQIAGDCQHQA
jgi:hypothetical protein